MDNSLIKRQDAIDAINGLIDRFERILAEIRETNGDESVCGMCEYDGAYMGQSGDWYNECPGFEKDDCFKLSEKHKKRWLDLVDLPSAQSERKKGEWISIFDEDESKCSECGKEYYYPKSRGYHFCPNCGADMRGEQDE